MATVDDRGRFQIAQKKVGLGVPTMNATHNELGAFLGLFYIGIDIHPPVMVPSYWHGSEANSSKIFAQQSCGRVPNTAKCRCRTRRTVRF